jgi:hypothetical protein
MKSPVSTKKKPQPISIAVLSQAVGDFKCKYLICEGSNGRFFEVTPEKELVWEYINPFYFKFPPPSVLEWNNTVFRAYRYSPDDPGLQGKVLDPERYELTLRERRAWKEKVVQGRMRRLGY